MEPQALAVINEEGVAISNARPWDYAVHWILEGKTLVEVDLLTWAAWFEDTDNRRINVTRVGRARVSTIFLGIDHNFSEEGPPLLFETLVFGGVADEEMFRSSTYDEALAIHQQVVQQLDIPWWRKAIRWLDMWLSRLRYRIITRLGK